jgi:hypothetical protein
MKGALLGQGEPICVSARPSPGMDKHAVAQCDGGGNDDA